MYSTIIICDPQNIENSKLTVISRDVKLQGLPVSKGHCITFPVSFHNLITQQIAQSLIPVTAAMSLFCMQANMITTSFF